MITLDLFTVRICKTLIALIKAFHLGAGATWPGEIALRLRPEILSTLSLHSHIILVAGTNGKTTTVKMIESILIKAGKRVARNASGANLDNGLVSTYLRHMNWRGTLAADYFVFEVDEATLPNILKDMTPDLLVLMNLFRDQLDRYGEVDSIAEKWLSVLKKSRNNSKGFPLIINGDDPQLAYIGFQISNNSVSSKIPDRVRDDRQNNDVSYFGLNDPGLFLPKMQHATDSIYCPNCGNRLTFGGVYFSHLGKYACGQCGFTHPDMALIAKDVTSPIDGVYNIYNTLAATLVAQTLKIPQQKTESGLAAFTPAFGRMETLVYKEKYIKILLSKNPTGFNESLRTYLSARTAGPLLIVLNDRIPDGTDVSWIWDVDFELLASYNQEIKEQKKRMIFVSGDRCYDIALRLKYAGVKEEEMNVSELLEEAIDRSVVETKEKETLWILATYSAMLEVRKVVVGRKIL